MLQQPEATWLTNTTHSKCLTWVLTPEVRISSNQMWKRQTRSPFDRNCYRSLLSMSYWSTVPPSTYVSLCVSPIDVLSRNYVYTISHSYVTTSWASSTWQEMEKWQRDFNNRIKGLWQAVLNTSDWLFSLKNKTKLLYHQRAHPGFVRPTSWFFFFPPISY